MATNDDRDVLEQPSQKTRHWASGINPAIWFIMVLVLISPVGILLAQLLVWLQGIHSRTVDHTGPESRQGVGQPVPYLGLEPLTGDLPRLSTGDLQGNVVLLNFWGTWCPPCRLELPHMAELYRRFGSRTDFRLAAVSVPEPGGHDVAQLRRETAALLERLHLDLPTYYDPDNKTLEALAPIIDLTGVPTSVLVDRHGVIRAVWPGYEPGVEREIQSYVDRLLSET